MLGAVWAWLWGTMLDWWQGLRGFLGWLCPPAAYQWPTDYPEYSHFDVEGSCPRVGCALPRLALPRFALPRYRPFSLAAWRKMGAVVSAVILLPIPVFAGLTFSWTSIRSTGIPPSVINPVVDANPSIIDFGVPAGAHSGVSGTITGDGTVTWDGSTTQGPNLKATYSGWNVLHLTSGSISFQVTYNTQTNGLFGPQVYTNTPPANQFSGTTPLVSPNTPVRVTFTIVFTNAKWTAATSSTPHLIFAQSP
jgi:hypothetical protein